MAVARVEKYHGSPAIMVDGVPYPPMMATIRTNTRDALKLDPEYFRELGKAGIRIFFVICDTEWLKPGAMAQFIEECETVLREVPDAWIMPRIGLHPPLEWIESHPDDIVRYSDGKTTSVRLYTESYEKQLPGMYSLCSENWRRDAGKVLLETYDAIEKLPFADRIIGYFLAAGNTSEWWYPGMDNTTGSFGFLADPTEHAPGSCTDISESFRIQFGKYLRETYGSEEDLRKAWNDPQASFDRPGIASFESREFMNNIDYRLRHPQNMFSTSPKPEPYRSELNFGTFLNMNTSRKTADHLRAWHLGTADSIVYFAALIKQRSRDKLVGAFYGSYGCTDFHYNGTAGGVRRILDSDVVDFLAAPGVYQNRQPGGFTGQREMVDSFRLKNRIFIVEEDTRTHAENGYYATASELYTPEDTLNIMKRDFGRNLCEDLHGWWFDQHIGGERYKFPEVYDLIHRQQEIAKEAYEKDRDRHNEIAFIYDEESIHFSSQCTTAEAVEFMHNYEISLIGASADRYYHNDMADPDMPSYKLYIFLNVYCLTDKEREAIHRKLRKDHAVALWMYAPGLVNPDREKCMDVANITQTSGITMKVFDGDIAGKFKFNGASHPATDGLDKGQIYGWNYRLMSSNFDYSTCNDSSILYPCFYPEDEKATVTGNFLEKPLPAFAVKEMDGWTSVYCGARLLRADVLRALAKYAGCHIFSYRDDVIYAGRNYVTIHAASSGEKELFFPKACTPFEVYEEKAYGRNVTSIRISLLKGETKTFELK